MNSFQLISTCLNLHNDNGAGPVCTDTTDSWLFRIQNSWRIWMPNGKKRQHDFFSCSVFIHFCRLHNFFFCCRTICSLGLVLSRVHVCAMSFCVILSLWNDFFSFFLSHSFSVVLLPFRIFLSYFVFPWHKKSVLLSIFFFCSAWIYASVAGHWIIYRNVLFFLYSFKFFPHIPSPKKVAWLKVKKNRKFISYAVCNWEESFG